MFFVSLLVISKFSGSTKDGINGKRNIGEDDAFVVKLDPNGKEEWTVVIGTQFSDVANGIAIDTAGNVIMTGTTYGDIKHIVSNIVLLKF